MKNPVPEVALPYVCEYLQVLLDSLLHPHDGINGADFRYVVEQTGMPESLALISAQYLHARGFTTFYVRNDTGVGATAWARLTARGYLVALELCEHGGLTSPSRSGTTSCKS